MFNKLLKILSVFVCLFLLADVATSNATVHSPKTGKRRDLAKPEPAKVQEQTPADESDVREKEEAEETESAESEEPVEEESETEAEVPQPTEEEAPSQPAEEESPTAQIPPGYERGPWDLPVQLDPGVSIGKIYDFLNDPKITKASDNPQLNYEFKYFTHGAVTKEQQSQKHGHYYVISWKNSGPATDLILRFDYRQRKTKDLVHTLEIPFPQTKGSKKGTFAVTGDAYHKLGRVQSWRVSVVRNGTIVAQKKSFIW